MRIVHIGTSVVPVGYRHGGALQRRMLEMARRQAALGHEVVVLSPGDRTGVVEVDGVVVQTLRLRSRRPARDYELLAHARWWLGRTTRRDILHAHGAPAAGSALRNRFAAAVHSVDYFQYRGSKSRAGARYYSARLDAFDVNLAVSEFCSREFSRFYPRVAGKTRILNNGVNRSQFRPDPEAALRARIALRLPSAPLVVYLGRVCVQKGSDLLGPLAEALRGRVPAATVVAAGPADQFGVPGSSSLVESLGRSGVRCLGAIDEEHIGGLLASAAVVVLPTRRDEMFGMAALEAIACGVPVVASDLGGIPEAVGPCGLLFPVGDGDAFVDAVARVLTDEGLAADLQAERTSHTGRFDWESVVAQSMNFYAEVLG